MRKLFFLLLVAPLFFISCSNDDDENEEEYKPEETTPSPSVPTDAVLDLSTFDLSDGISIIGEDGQPSQTEKYWKHTYNTGVANVKSQIFTFSHSSVNIGYKAWDGFTVSNSTDNISHNANNDWVEKQWGCMAKGGYAGEGTPFIIGYPAEKADFDIDPTFSESRFTAWIKIDDNNNKYKASEVYICNHPWTYHTITEGSQFARKFAQGDFLKLKIFGVKADNTIITDPVEFYLADYRSDNESEWKLNSEWEKVDISSLGEVKYLYFRVETTDMSYGYSNTPLQFCLDKLKLEAII
jgi:hypothetical protein